MRLGYCTRLRYYTRLKNLLEYYCRSRTVEHDFDRLFSLFVANGVKAMLPQPCLNLILLPKQMSRSWHICVTRLQAWLMFIMLLTHMMDGK